MKTGKQRLDEINSDIDRGDWSAKRIISAPRRAVVSPNRASSIEDVSWTISPPYSSYTIVPGRTWFERCKAALSGLRTGAANTAKAMLGMVVIVYALACYAAAILPFVYLCATGRWILAVILAVCALVAPEIMVVVLFVFSAVLISAYLEPR